MQVPARPRRVATRGRVGLLSTLAVATLTATALADAPSTDARLSGPAPAASPIDGLRATARSLNQLTATAIADAAAAQATGPVRSARVITAAASVSMRDVPVVESVMVAGAMGNARIVVQAAPTPAERRVRVKAPWTASCSGAYRPGQPGVIRPSGLTQVISV